MTFEITSTLAGDPKAFLSRFDLAAVNRELGPWLRMTAPAPYSKQPIVGWPTGRPLFRSWILLFGVFPIDRHYFHLEAADEDRGFEEASSSWMTAVWRHGRTVEADRSGMRITDRIEWRARLPASGLFLGAIYRSVFRHRHRHLRSTAPKHR